jgi:WD40 repeat protein
LQWQVIVRDIVSKLLIVQFRAHTSPISALCFDPSGTLLVTASVHGQNINVFRIIPPPHGTSETGQIGTYVHLYKLQRGITNAVSWHTYFSVIICNVVDRKSITFLVGHKRHQL